MKKQKISELLIGTNNKGKLREIRDLLPKKIKIYSTSDFQIKSPKETGKTFRENSIIKAKYFSKKTNLICLSDDSGLEIDILKKKPGIYSARWAGKKNNFNLYPNKISFLSYDLVGLVYYLAKTNDLVLVNKIFDKQTVFKGKTGIFEIENKNIKHLLNFYKVENNKFKEIF